MVLRQASDLISKLQNLQVTNDSSEIKLNQESWDHLHLQNPIYGITNTVISAYKNLGIVKMYEWQSQCLLLCKKCKNVVLESLSVLFTYLAFSRDEPLTKVAEILVSSCVLENSKCAMIIEPFVSVVSEKVDFIRKILPRSRIHGYHSNTRHIPLENIDVAVCTIERGNSLINRLLIDGGLDKIGLIVVDELHLLGDPNRGYLLELLLTKILISAPQIRIIGLSATLPNIQLLAEWLDANLFISDYRPVPLSEHVIIKNCIYDTEFKLIRKLAFEPHPQDPDMLIPLCFEVVQENKSVLIFASSKDLCEKTSLLISSLMNVSIDDYLHNNRLELVRSLSKSQTGLDPILEKTIPKGVSFHHAGLTLEEREMIEHAFRSGIVQVLVSTSTLSSGVNLPARRVILYPKMGPVLLDSKTYQQMVGRAGRKGQDIFGESFLVCKKSDQDKISKIVKKDLEAVASCLTLEQRGMKRALLEVLALKIVSTRNDIEKFIQKTMLYHQDGLDYTRKVANESLEFLLKNEMIKKVDTDSIECFVPLKLGTAISYSSLSPEEGQIIFSELIKAMKRYVLAGDLYTIYHITPIFTAMEVDWSLFYKMYLKFDDDVKDVALIAGVNETFLFKASQNYISWKTERNQTTILVHRRFWGALILNDLINEVPFQSVVEKYQMNRGFVQMLQLNSSTFAGMVSVFCENLGWTSLKLLIDQFKVRLNFGIQAELAELCQLPQLKSYQARILYNSGITSVKHLACSSWKSLFEIFSNHEKCPTHIQEASKDHVYLEKLCKSLINSAHLLLQEEQQQLIRSVNEVKSMLEREKD